MVKPIVLFIELKMASKNRYVCEITEKLFQNDISVTIFATGKSAQQIDNLLWTWKQESFIPHQLNTGDASANGQVLISDSPENLSTTQAILLYNPLPMETLKNYNLIIDFAEIYHSDKKLESRKRYKKLRDSDCFDIHFTHLGALLSKQNIILNKLF